MLNSNKIHGPSREDYMARFVLDFFVFSTLANGVMCSSSQSQNDLRSFDIKKNQGPERFVHVAPRANGHAVSSGNALTVAVFDKMLHWIFDHEIERDKVGQIRDERSFGIGQRFVGHRKRLQFALLPIMYKMGVMTTLLTGLTVFALKGLTIGLILLMFSLGNHFIKNGKQSWNQSGQPIHVHVHSTDKADKYGKYHEYENEIVSGPWDREEIQEHYSKPYIPESWDSYRKNYYQHPSEMLKLNSIV